MSEVRRMQRCAPYWCVLLALAVGVVGCVADDGGPAEPAEQSHGGGGASAAGGAASGATTGGSGAADGSSTASSSSGAGGSSSGAGGGDSCPPGVVCVTSFPFSHSSSTLGASSNQFDSYACGSQNEAGPEVVYRVDIPSEGFLILDLPESGMGVGVDVDVHLLGSLDSSDCIDRGHWQVGELLPAGQYYVTADTWTSDDGVPAAGDYTLEFGLVTLQDLEGWGMSAALAEDALRIYDHAWEAGEVDTPAYAVVDFAMHASERRMWVFDVFDAALLHHTFTTVGDMSDPNGDGWADVFSNQSGSHQSSLGLMKAAESYSGTYGESVRLDGLESGYNDAVRSRAIVLHPWNGSTQAYVDANTAAGAAPTWGCLGVDPAIVVEVRDFLSGGGLVLSHFPDGDWSAHSSYLQ